MEITFEQIGRVGIFNFSGELTAKHEDRLKLALMKAIHSIDKAVLNFREVTKIDETGLLLLNQAYRTSIRLNNPLIILNLRKNYLGRISGLPDEADSEYFPGKSDEYDSTKKETAYQ